MTCAGSWSNAFAKQTPLARQQNGVHVIAALGLVGKHPSHLAHLGSREWDVPVPCAQVE